MLMRGLLLPTWFCCSGVSWRFWIEDFFLLCGSSKLRWFLVKWVVSLVNCFELRVCDTVGRVVVLFGLLFEWVPIQQASSGAAMAASVRDVPICTTCCSFGSVASTPGCSNFELSDAAGQSLRFTFPADGMLKLPLRNRQRRKQLGMQVVARWVWSLEKHVC